MSRRDLSPHTTRTCVGLPRPGRDGGPSLASALGRRRSVRDYCGGALTRAEVAQLLWAAQGITGPDGLRTAPSAGALYPLEVLVVVGEAGDLPPGVYRYRPEQYDLVIAAEGDARAALGAAALEQPCVGGGAVVIALIAMYGRTTGKYGRRGIRYVHMEAGHAAQNVCLQAAALGLGAVVVGAFDDGRVKRVLGLAAEEDPLCLIPVGRLRA